uniref:Uncharacterized protein n=1 Tax=Schizophyllum commune (strain H4-8 / FGSC 9210) TaxID=578458 RepID=D8QKR8_SCHCM
MPKLTRQKPSGPHYEHTPSTCHIAQLPPELLSAIFMMCGDPNILMGFPREDVAGYAFTHEKAIILGHVCQRWYAITRGDPRLWTLVDIAAPKRSDLFVLDFCLQHSGSLPLSLELDLLDRPNGLLRKKLDTEGVLVPLMRIVAMNARRWESISMIIATEHGLIAPLLSVFPGGFSSLRRASVEAYPVGSFLGDPIVMLHELFYTSPHLQAINWWTNPSVLAASQCRMENLSQIGVHLEHNATEVLTVLERCTRLQVLSARFDDVSGSTPRLRTRKVVHAPHLHTLMLGSEKYDFGWMYDHLELPGLRRLDVTPLTFHGKDIERMLTRSGAQLQMLNWVHPKIGHLEDTIGLLHSPPLNSLRVFRYLANRNRRDEEAFAAVAQVVPPHVRVYTECCYEAEAAFRQLHIRKFTSLGPFDGTCKLALPSLSSVGPQDSIRFRPSFEAPTFREIAATRYRSTQLFSPAANAQNTTPSSPVGQASRIQTRTTPIDVRRRGIFGRIFSSIPLRRNLTRSHPTHDTTNAPANNDPTLDEIRQPPNVVLDQILHAIEQQTRVQDQGLNRLTEAIIQASSYPSDDDDDPNSPAAPGSTEEADVDGPNDDAQFSDTSYGRPAPPTLRASTREPPATSGAEPSSTAGAPGRASASQAGPSNHTAQSSLNSGGGGSHAPAPLLGCTAQSSGALDDPRSPHLSRGYTAGGNVNPRLESKRRKRRTFIGYSASLPKDGAFHGNRLSVYVGTKDELRKLFRDEDIRPFWDGLGLLLPFCEGYAHELTQLHIYIFQPCLNEDLTYKQDMLVPVLDALRPRLPNFLSVTISFSCGDQVSQDLGSLTQTIRAAFFALRHLRLEGFAKLPRLFLFPVEDLRVLEILSQTAVAEVDMIQLMVWCKQLDFFQVHSFGNPASERTYFAPDPNPSVAYPHVMHFVHDHLSDLFIQNIPNDRIVHLTVTDTAEYRQKELLFGGNTFWSLKCDDSN